MALFRYTWRTFSRELTLLAVAAIFFIPVYLLLTLSLKSTPDLYTKPLTFPTNPELQNYAKAWDGASGISLGRSLLNSTIITGCSVVGLILIGSPCAFAMARRPSKVSTLMYATFLIGVIVPFQLAVVPIFVAMRYLHLTPSYIGMVLLNMGLLMPLTVFLYTGFVRAMPRDYEEAAQVDGAGLVRTFFRIVFPLLRPVTGTVAVLTGVITWNEFFLPLIFLNGSHYGTLPLAVYAFVGDYLTQWNYVFASVAIAVAPVMLFYILAQRQLIRGFAGGVKG